VIGRVATWLHRHGIARTLSSETSSSNPTVTYLMEGRRWTPRWLIVWAANHRFRSIYPSRTTYLRLSEVERHDVALNGARRWSLRYRPARPWHT
jgi:hypothetical protein